MAALPPSAPVPIPDMESTQPSSPPLPLTSAAVDLADRSTRSPPAVMIHPSLGSLLVDHNESEVKQRLHQLYPEDTYGGGNYAELPLGNLKYWIVGPEDGVKVVLINGMAVPACSWSLVVPHLTAAGNRVLLFDHYGRGYSEAPQVPHTVTFYNSQLAQLLQHVGWDKPRMVGLSLGGGILAAFTAAFPDLVGDKIVFIAPAGVKKNRTVLSRTKAGNRDELVRLQQTVLPGFTLALESSMREGPTCGQERAFSAIGRDTKRKALMIWGTGDQVVPFRFSSELCARMPQATLVAIPDGGHDIMRKHSDLVGSTLAEFLVN